MPLNWNDSTVPGWQTMWQLTPVGIASADRSVHDINEGLREMARLSHSRTEGMLNRKAQKDAQKRQQKQQNSMFKKQVGTSVGLGLATAGLSAGIGALAAPAVEAPAAAAKMSSGASSSLAPVAEGAGTLSSTSAPIAESASGGLSPIVGTADSMGIPSLVPSETGATYSLGDFANTGVSGLAQDTANAPIPASASKLLNPTGQMGTGVGGATNDQMMYGQHYGSGAGDFWSRFGRNFGMQMLGQAPYWAMMGAR